MRGIPVQPKVRHLCQVISTCSCFSISALRFGQQMAASSNLVPVFTGHASKRSAYQHPLTPAQTARREKGSWQLLVWARCGRKEQYGEKHNNKLKI